jgi:uncharacterized protein YqhQ
VVSRVRPRSRRGLLVWARKVLFLRGIAAFVEHGLLWASASLFALCQADLLRALPGAAVGSHALPGFAPTGQRRSRTWRMLVAWLFWALLGVVLVLGGVPVIFADVAKQADALGCVSAASLRFACGLMGIVGSGALLTGYINLVGHSPSFSRLLTYHGAEHQVRAAYRAGAPLTLTHICNYPGFDPGCVLGRAVVLTVLGFGVSALLGFAVAPLGAVLDAADGSWAHLMGAVALRAVGVILAAGPYRELRILAQRHKSRRLDAVLRGPAAWLCGPADARPPRKVTEVAYLALLRLLDTQDAAALRGHKAPSAFPKMAGACVRLGRHESPTATPSRRAGDAR